MTEEPSQTTVCPIEATLRDAFSGSERPSLFELRKLLAQEDDLNSTLKARAQLWATIQERELNARGVTSTRTADSDYQVHVAWRMVRLHLHVSNTLDRREPIDSTHGQLVGLGPDGGWRTPLKMPPTPSGLTTAERLVLQPRPGLWLNFVQNPSPVLPPHDALPLGTWQNLYAHLALALRTHRPPPPAYTSAQKSAVLRLLQHPERHWPDPEEIIRHEDMLISQTRRMALEHNLVFAVEWMKTHYGLSNIEAQAMLKLYASSALKSMSLDTDEARAISLERWESRLQKAEQAMDHRAAQQAQARIDSIHGLGRTNPEDAAAEFAQIVFNTSSRAPKRPKPPLIDTKPILRLPEPSLD